MATNKSTGTAGKKSAKRPSINDPIYRNPTPEQQERWEKEEKEREQRRKRMDEQQRLYDRVIEGTLTALTAAAPELTKQLGTWMEQEVERRSLAIQNLKLENKFLEVQIAFLEQRLAQGKPVVEVNENQV